MRVPRVRVCWLTWTIGIAVIPALVAALGGCAGSREAVPVMGASSAVSRLAGAWTGDYSSIAMGRSGSISFDLSAGADTAYGSVVMIPRMTQGVGPSSENPAANPGSRPTPRTLSISFVRAAGDSVMGVLAPYDDPECGGCTLYTRFQGRIQGDRIEGVYWTSNSRTRDTLQGQWKVRRKKG